MNLFRRAWQWLEDKEKGLSGLQSLIVIGGTALVLLGVIAGVPGRILDQFTGDGPSEPSQTEIVDEATGGSPESAVWSGESMVEVETEVPSTDPIDDLPMLEERPEASATPTPVPGCDALDSAATTDQFIVRWNDVVAGGCSAGSLDFEAVSPIRPGSENRVDEAKRRFTLENGTDITVLLDAEGLVTSIEAGAATLPAVEQTSAVAVVALGSASAPAPDLLDFETRSCLREPDYGQFDAWHTGNDPDFEVFVEICPDRSS